MRGRGSLATVALIVATSVACDQGAPAERLSMPAARASDKGFVLDVRLPRATFLTADAIPVTTTLTWTGAAPTQAIWGSGMGPVSFGFEEVGGSKRVMGGVMTSDCSQKEFPRGVAVAIPLRKTGAWEGNDPNGAFYTAWFKDPVLHLPLGSWRLVVSAGGYLAPCDQAAPTFEAKAAPIEIVIR